MTLGGAFPREHHSFDFTLVLYQIFRFVTIPKEKAISHGYSFFVYIKDLSNNQKTQFFKSQKLSNCTILLITYSTHILFITR